MDEMVLLTGVFIRNDLKGIVSEHRRVFKLSAAYDHEFYPDDSLTEGVLTYNEVIKKIRHQTPA